jgi:tetratricopeptide (TPR) repeat protein
MRSARAIAAAWAVALCLSCERGADRLPSVEPSGLGGAEGSTPGPFRTDARKRALALVATSRFAESIPLLEALLAQNPEDPLLVEAIAEAQARVGRLEETERHAAWLLEKHPEREATWLLRGLLLAARGDASGALDAYGEALERNPASPVALLERGTLALVTGQLDLALGDLTAAEQLGFSSPELHSNLGNAYFYRGFYARAAASYGRAIELAPALPELRLNLGLALEGDGRLDSALGALREAQALDPENPYVLTALGRVLWRRGDEDEGEEALEAAIALRPRLALPYRSLALLLEEAGRLEEAVRTRARAREARAPLSEDPAGHPARIEGWQQPSGPSPPPQAPGVSE